MKARLDYIESRLQALIEKTVQRFGGDMAPHPLAHQLVIAMQESLMTGDDGRLIAPQSYIILLNPQDLPTWQSNTGLLDSLKNTLEEAAHEAGVLFEGPPIIRLMADADVQLDDIRVDALNSAQEHGTTGSLPLYRGKTREPFHCAWRSSILGGDWIII
jgi:hypothetical protein